MNQKSKLELLRSFLNLGKDILENKLFLVITSVGAAVIGAHLGSNLIHIFFKLINRNIYDNFLIYMLFTTFIGLGVSFLDIKLIELLIERIEGKKEKINAELLKIDKKKSNLTVKRQIYLRQEKERQKVLAENGQFPDMSSKIDLFIEISRDYGFIKEELTKEWEEYLKNTIISDDSLEFIKELCFKLRLLNETIRIDKIIDILLEDEEMAYLIIYFGRKGEQLDKLIKKDLTKDSFDFKRLLRRKKEKD